MQMQEDLRASGTEGKQISCTHPIDCAFGDSKMLGGSGGYGGEG